VVDIVGVQELELLALVVGHDFAVVLFLGPVDVGSLRSQPGDVGGNEDHTTANDDEQRLKSDVVTQTLHGQALHDLAVVLLPAPGLGDVPHVDTAENLGHEHLYSLVEVNQAILVPFGLSFYCELIRSHHSPFLIQS